MRPSSIDAAIDLLTDVRLMSLPHARRDVVREAARIEVEAAARADGVLFADRHAVMLNHLDHGAWCGEPTRHVVAAWRPGERDARRRVEDAISRADLCARTLLMLDAPCRGLAPAPLDAGLHLDSIILVGDVAFARQHIGDRDAPAGIRIRPGRAEDAGAIVEVQRAVFARDPDPCWFGANPRWLDAVRNDWTDTHDAERGVARVVEQDGAVVGFATGGPERAGRWGVTAGLSLVLHEQARGRGVSRAMHGALLDGLFDRGVRWFNGGTSNPAVLRRAVRMGRVHVADVWRVRPAHPAGRFGPWGLDTR